ncbi:hypothetical protein HOR11_gp047 [Lactobacillus phage SA-C12]|uniref:Uncharacterized protein n=1 Tax=Lactobacillus phage SA-C12 TaxID=1755697 RepID=A0A1I9KK96_9CAUD|nr:hypothetical protein HOR11_gp047 [Lactobacillus phage SA-C12]ALY06868.1 hypothetical protein SAC12_047 [Lactobacillus phage SA-C12]
MTKKDFYRDLKIDLRLEGNLSARIVGNKMLVTNKSKHLSVNCKRNKVSIEYDGKVIEDQYYYTDNMVVLTSEKIVNILGNNL